MKRTIEFTRVNADINGNSRHVCHFLNFVTNADNPGNTVDLPTRYALAVQRAHKLGGRKYHNKQYGGGIVFQVQSGCLDALTQKIFAMTGTPKFEAVQRRAVVLVKFHPTTGNNDNRYSVTIRDFPKRFYNASTAENAGIHGQDQAEYFAELRCKELGLDWTFQAAGTLPTGEAVFTV